MLKMVDRQAIIHMFRVLGMSRRAIANEVKCNRKTVNKIIQEYEAAIHSNTPEESLDDVLTLNPTYDSSGRKFRRLSGEMISIIDKCLDSNNLKKAAGLRKQQMKKCDIYELLRDKGFDISYSTVCNYIRTKCSSNKDDEAFIRQQYDPGFGVEFDWGEVKLVIDDKKVRFFMAVFTFQCSNARISYLFRHQNTLAFLESHRNFFRDVKGVPTQMIYDNMRVAVAEFVMRDKKPTEALLRMSDFYCFQYRFCNVRAGWEKGHVERAVEYVRRKAFGLHDHFASIEDAQSHLISYCERSNVQCGSLATIHKKELYEADLASLQPLPGNIGCFEMEDHSVDKWSTASLGCVHYSVPDNLVGKRVQVKIYSEKLVFYYQGVKVATHERSYTSGDWKIDINHYLDTMSYKPGAIRGSLALKQAPASIRNLFETHFTSNAREFISLLIYARDGGFSFGDIMDAYNVVVNSGVQNLSADHIKATLHRESSTAPDTQSDDIQRVDIEASANRTVDELSIIMENPVLTACRI